MEINSFAAYTNYRQLLHDTFLHKKSINPAFSFRRFAQIVGFKSPNYLQLILEGKRNITEDTAKLIAEKLKFSASEKSLFLALVRIANANSAEDKVEAEKYRLIAIKRLVAKEIPSAKAQVLSTWYYLLVRELFFLKDCVPTGAWISKKLAGLISEKEAEDAITLLIKAGFLQYKNNKYTVIDPVLDTNEQKFQHAFMQKYHAQLLKIWSQNLEKLCITEQELGVLNIPINAKKIPELRKKIRQFQDEIIGWLQDEKEADQIVQLGTYLFPFP